jgi:tetratricopeptide (TPR) repeat protein
MQWLADRFFVSSGRWIDAASGSLVHILIEDASGINALDWDEQCARLANARHTLLNPLIDYGAAPDGRRFEVYSVGSDAAGDGASAARGLAHVTAFLRAGGVSPDSMRCRFAIRATTHGRGAGDRPLGITLQPRRALDAVDEVLATSFSSGPAVISVTGPVRAGLKTLRTFIARTARLAGFAPTCASLLAQPGFEILPERHICVLDDGSGDARWRRGVARRLMDLSGASARRHVVVRFERERSGRSAIALEPMSVRSLVGMVFVSEADGPSEAELFSAARAAAGRPGDYLATLQRIGFGAARSATMSVHETPHTYSAECEAAAAPAPPRRRGISSASRAVARAETLARRGRHAAAMRVLRRSAHVLSGRGHADESGECLVAAGHLALRRGRVADAAGLFDEARGRCGVRPVAFRAAAGLGDAWIDAGRLTEAEVLLRGTLAAADTVSDTRGASALAAVLVRALYHQSRYNDALAAVASREWGDGSAESAALLAIVARCHAALGRIAPALRLGRAALSAAEAQNDATVVVRASLAVAEVFATAGDLVGMKGELRKTVGLARDAHLPLMVLEAHLVELEHLEPGRDPAVRSDSLRGWSGLKKTALPRLLRDRVDRVLAGPPSKITGSPRRGMLSVPADARRDGAEILEQLLQEGQRAADDSTAVGAICSAVVRRVQAATVLVQAAQDRRVLAAEGRAWVAHSTVIAQTLATGMPSATESGCEPREAAAPVRYGGEVIAVIASRWTAGAEVDGYGAAAVLHAAALAVAAPVRAVLDRALPPAPPGAWGDLLGDSTAAATLRDAVMRAARAPFPVLIEGAIGAQPHSGFVGVFGEAALNHGDGQMERAGKDGVGSFRYSSRMIPIRAELSMSGAA